MIAIADSSGIISAFVAVDRNHKKAAQVKRKLEKSKGMMYVPAEIFAETVNIVGKKLNHVAAMKLAETLLETKLFVIAPSTEYARSHALEIFQNQPESVSFTDCLVMAFADEFETKAIFGFDESFRKNGYKRIGIDK